MAYTILESAVVALEATNAALVESVDSIRTDASAAQLSATASAESALTSKNSAAVDAGTASTKASEAAISAASAAAVVTGGTASLTPAAGKIPLANSKGHIAPTWFIVDQLRASVEAASGGRTTVIYTNEGNPSYMHILPAFNCEDIAPGGELGTGVHPAFMFDGVRASEIMVGAHLGGVVGTQLVSRPGLSPHTAINYDTARALCQANGAGWDLMSNLDWAAISLWCKANGYEPRGNTDWGRHHVNKWGVGRRGDKGIPGDATGNGSTLTGSGPASWAHDGTPAGIHDLVGNVAEWVTGLKLIDGRVWLAPDNGKNEESAYIDTGFDLTAGVFSATSNVGASNLVKQSLIVPATAALAPVGQVYVDATTERLPVRGGFWAYAGNAGLGCLSLYNARSYTSAAIGLRPRFRAL